MIRYVVALGPRRAIPKMTRIEQARAVLRMMRKSNRRWKLYKLIIKVEVQRDA